MKLISQSLTLIYISGLNYFGFLSFFSGPEDKVEFYANGTNIYNFTIGDYWNYFKDYPSEKSIDIYS